MTQTEEQKRNLNKLTDEYIIHLCGESLCTRCKYFKEGEHKDTCKAFPDGMPSDIRYGGFDHTKPYKGDNGIQFESIK